METKLPPISSGPGVLGLKECNHYELFEFFFGGGGCFVLFC